MNMQLRDYQKDALNKIWYALLEKDNALLVAATGAGKTIMFSFYVEKILTDNPDNRCLIVCDREILVQQAFDKMMAIGNIPSEMIGICCAKLKQRDVDKPITIASRQTLVNAVRLMPPQHLIIYDEVHQCRPPTDKVKPDTFNRIFNILKAKNEDMKFIGVTATPYRLGVGYIYGNKNKKGVFPYFSDVDARITIAELLAKGYLSPYRLFVDKNSSVDSDYASVKKVGGDFNIRQLEEVATKKIHIDSVINAIQKFGDEGKYGKRRKRILIFATTIKHADMIAEAIGDEAVSIHSDNDNHVDMGHRVLVSVAKLTTGLDKTDIDLIIGARKTLSPALFVQMFGRGLRIHEGKENLLYVDLVGNLEYFGKDFDNPKVIVPGSFTGEAPTKLCKGITADDDFCGEEVHLSKPKCDKCGYVFPVKKGKEKKVTEFKEVDPVLDITVPCAGIDMALVTNKKNGKRSIKITLYGTYEFKVVADDWLFFVGDGYSGAAYHATKAKFGKYFQGEKMPYRSEQAINMINKIKKPKSFSVKPVSYGTGWKVCKLFY